MQCRTQGSVLAQEFERELQLAGIERDRKLKQIAAIETTKDRAIEEVKGLSSSLAEQSQLVHLQTLLSRDGRAKEVREIERLKILEEELQC